MTTRAAASAATGQRILEAAQRLFGELPYDQVSLQAVAERADVTVQTVLRRFASKEQLFAAVAERTSRQIRSERDAAPVGDVAGVVCNVVDNYERWGDHFLNLLAQEQRTAAIRAVTDTGRRYHRGWVERSFVPLLAQVPPDDYARRLAQLVAVTDLYVWKVLRRDLGLPRDETEAAVRDLVYRIVGPD
jgi:AcrR family transcriptional regulator